MKTKVKLWTGIAVLAILSPLGLILPERFKSTAAWGEWSSAEVGKLAGYIPRGLEKLSALWNAPLADYCIRGWESKGLAQLSIGYIISAALGIAATVAAMLLIGKFLAKK